jgi:hypothetical protein
MPQLHLLDRICPHCGRQKLTYSRPRQKGDLYVCDPATGGCRSVVIHQGGDGRLMAASYMIRGGSFVPEKPRLWTARKLATIGFGQNFDLAPDGERVAGILPADTPESRETLRHITLMLNFPDEVRRRMGK